MQSALVFLITLFSLSVHAQQTTTPAVYCTAQRGYTDYDSIGGHFVVDVQCSDAKKKIMFDRWGCYTDSCTDQFMNVTVRKKLEAKGIYFITEAKLVPSKIQLFQKGTVATTEANQYAVLVRQAWKHGSVYFETLEGSLFGETVSYGKQTIGSLSDYTRANRVAKMYDATVVDQIQNERYEHYSILVLKKK